MSTNVEINIRLGDLDDIFQIAEVFSDSVRELCKKDYDSNTILRWIATKPPESRSEYIKNNSLWVAELNGKIVGYLISVPGEVIALFVASSYTGLGIGRALGELGIEIAKNGSVHDVKLQSTISAVQFYKKLGFNEVGRGFYTHCDSDLKLPIVNMALS